MGPPSVEYVCWIDVMGSRSIMLRSASIAANFVMKLHVAALHAKEAVAYPDLELYPMIDGVYACAPAQGPMLAYRSHGACIAICPSRSLNCVMLTSKLLRILFHSFV